MISTSPVAPGPAVDAAGTVSEHAVSEHAVGEHAAAEHAVGEHAGAEHADGAPDGSIPWVKGHGTQNDFVLLEDPDGELFGDLDPGLVRRLCDRRTGVGGDGVLRVVRTAAVPDAPAGVGAQWFMDYRNADGSVAEMCGNGVRVFAEYLLATGRVAPGEPVELGTRSGARTAVPLADPPGWWSVDMGTADVARYRPEQAALTVRTPGADDGSARPAVGVDVGNPHAVVLVDDVADAGPLVTAPVPGPAAVFPDGVNVEFAARRGSDAFAMRVFERGAGETRSCGTGICAAAAALAAADDPAGAGGERTLAVTVPGGDLRVTVTPAADSGGQRWAVTLAGPAELTGHGRLAVTGAMFGPRPRSRE